MLLGALLGVLGSADGQAASLRKYAGIVVDAKSGEELYSQSANESRYPASVTKVMTLYILFEELNAGRLKMNSSFSVSRHAAAAPPTKLGLRPGSSIKVEDAIKALVTHSANDVARVIAENIGGTESKFAERMTATAKALGMNHTTYRNASGLPDSGQLTTVRDQARLGAAVYEHFPDYYAYFQTRSFHYNGRNYGNHNQLLGSNGVDGIKTGYINASGYNLLTAARKDGRHIIVVGFGFNTGAARNSKVAQLIRKYLPKARRGDYLNVARIPLPSKNSGNGVPGNRFASNQPVYPMPRPDGRASDSVRIAIAANNERAPIPLLPPDGRTPANASEAIDLVASNGKGTASPGLADDVLGAWISKNLQLAASDGMKTNQPLLPPVRIGGTEVASAEPVAAESGWVVQIGALPSELGAKTLIGDARSRVTGLERLQPYVERIDKNGQVFYRARFSGIGGRAEAKSFCDALIKKEMSCLALQS